MTSTTPGRFYEEQIGNLTTKLKDLKSKHSLLGWGRFASIVVLCFTIYFMRQQPWQYIFLTVVLFLALFLWLVARSLHADRLVKNTERLIAINKKELEVLAGNYKMNDSGEEFIRKLNLFDNDLDLFGNASIFQYLSRANSEHGKNELAHALVKTLVKDAIIDTQYAVKELAERLEWCQQLFAYTGIATVSLKTEHILGEWIGSTENGFDKPVWKILRVLVPAVSFTILGLYLVDILTDSGFTVAMIIMLGIVYSFYKRISERYSTLSKIIDALNAFLPTLQWIEQEDFKSPMLQKIQGNLRHGNKSASGQIKELKDILARFDYRLNPVVHIPLSIFLFWDLQQVLALEQWRKAQSGQVGHWFNAMGRMEMLASLGVLHFNQPKWTFPEITDEWFDLECRQVGHPLIREAKLVSSDFSMKGTPQVTLITGSNMAGKSTFLRTIGANMVLATCGAPVCAAFMRTPVVRVISSMRIMDNLEEETSTFYAELKKMKRIVEAANAKEKVFILIDEMLRGTNTLDRHTGSVALVRQLVKAGAVAIIASHDIALADLKTDYPNAIDNYHFDSTIINGEIIFDYKIKSGVCKSTNASLLMKKIGIDLD